MTQAYDKSVFLNYPYDLAHRPIVDAMVFGILACGFSPRSAEEEIGGLNHRMDRLISLISECRHGIHDMSKSTEVAHMRPRLNMPFELGIFYGAMKLGDEMNRNKDGFIFDEEFSRNHSAFSDTSGLDLQPHRGEPLVALVCIQRYLKSRTPDNIIGPKPLVHLFLTCVDDIPDACDNYGLIHDELSFSERRGLMATWIERRASAANRPL